MTDKVERVAEMVWIARQSKRDPSEPSTAHCIFKHGAQKVFKRDPSLPCPAHYIFKHDAQKVLEGIPPYSVLHIISLNMMHKKIQNAVSEMLEQMTSGESDNANPAKY